MIGSRHLSWERSHRWSAALLRHRGMEILHRCGMAYPAGGKRRLFVLARYTAQHQPICEVSLCLNGHKIKRTGSSKR